MACQHEQSWVFFSKFQLAVLEKHINVASCRGLLRAMEITPGRRELQTIHWIFALRISTHVYHIIHLCITLWLLLILAEIFCDSGCPVESWNLFFLFLHLISKHHWLHSNKLMWLEGPRLISGFAKVFRFLSLHIYCFFWPPLSIQGCYRPLRF